MIPNQLLFYCRSGFEEDLSAEITDRAASFGYRGYPVAQKGNGFIRFVLSDEMPGNELHRALALDILVFARQSLLALAPLDVLPRDNRLAPIIEQVVASGWSFESLWQETPDTNDAKALAGLLKALQRPLESQLRRRGALRRKAGGRRLHLFWTQGDHVQLGMSFPGNRSEYPGGVKRLRFPHDAPSRSTLKLEEAWHIFVPKDQWSTRICQGMQAADLGAAAGRVDVSTGKAGDVRLCHR